IYLDRDGASGDAMADWLQAEYELCESLRAAARPMQSNESKPRPAEKRAKPAAATFAADAPIMALGQRPVPHSEPTRSAPLAMRMDSISAFAPIYDGPYAVFELD